MPASMKVTDLGSLARSSACPDRGHDKGCWSEERCLARVNKVGVIFDEYASIGNATCWLRGRHACERRHGNVGVGMAGH